MAGLARRARARLRGWLHAPNVADPDERGTAASVHFVCLSFLGAAAVWTVAALFLLPDPRSVLPVTGGIMLGIGVAFALVHVGRVRAGASLLVASLWLGATLSVALGGGVQTPAVSTYLVAILCAGLLVGRAAAIALTVVSGVATGILAGLEARGALPALIEHTPWSAAGVEMTLFVAAAALLVDALGRIEAAKRRVQQSEARARSLIEEAADGIVVLDGEARIREANARAEELSGYGRDELAGTPLSELLDEGEYVDARRLMGQLPSGRVVVRERRLRRKDGSVLEVENSLKRLADGGFQAIVRDVSARKAAERMHDHLRVALEEAGEAILLLDPNGRLLYANRAFREAYAGGAELQVGTPAAALRPEPDRSDLKAVRATLAKGETWVGRHERLGDDGSRSVSFAIYAPARERSGELVGFVGVLRDVTREVELEESLRQTQKLQAVGQLAGGLAHDFNNLLTVVLGAGHELRQRQPSGEIDEILDAARRAADLTTQLLAFSRRQPVRTERLDLNALLRSAEPVLDRLVREDVTLSLELSDEPVWLDVDPNQLHQVLVNVAANARDAMPEGGRLTIRAEREDLGPDEARPLRIEPGPFVMLELEDSGEGMSEEVVERIFEPFFTTKSPGRGTGLGLSSVHGIVQQAGGAVEVESRPGKGTRFRIHLPQAEAAAQGGLGSEPAPGAPRPARVLVVEDDPAVRRLLCRTLAAQGHRVWEAEDGAAALALDLPSGGIDLLVSDVVLPRMAGPEVAAVLEERHPGLRVLLISGHVPEEAGTEVAEGEGREFLQKPFHPQDLLDAVARLLVEG